MHRHFNDQSFKYCNMYPTLNANYVIPPPQNKVGAIFKGSTLPKQNTYTRYVIYMYLLYIVALYGFG